VIGAGVLEASTSPRQWPDANPPGLDHDQIAHELVRMRGNDLGYRVSLRRVRDTIEFQQHHAANPQTLANDQFAKIAILRDQDAALIVRRLENIPCPGRPISFRGSISR